MARKRKVTRKDGITYRLKYGEQINQDQGRVPEDTALRNIVRPLSVVDIATRGGKPVTKKRIGEQRRRTVSKEVNTEGARRETEKAAGRERLESAEQITEGFKKKRIKIKRKKK